MQRELNGRMTNRDSEGETFKHREIPEGERRVLVGLLYGKHALKEMRCLACIALKT